MMSDGEQQEGSTWEGVMFAGSHNLSKLTAFVDVNRNQINGPTHEIMPIMDELKNKYEAFGWLVQEIDGGDIDQVRQALDAARDTEHPNVIICHTVTGQGVPYMEGDFHWHHGVITDEKFKDAMVALGEAVGEVPDDSWRPGSAPQPSADTRQGKE
jgi:transketolase